MKKTKLSLEALKVKSFVTVVSKQLTKGGADEYAAAPVNTVVQVSVTPSAQCYETQNEQLCGYGDSINSIGNKCITQYQTGCTNDRPCSLPYGDETINL